MQRPRTAATALPAMAIASAIALVVAGAPGTARAVGVPGSALARSLQMHPSLVDSPAQAFEHPQVTVLGPSSLTALEVGDYGDVSAIDGTLRIRQRFALAAGSQWTTSDLDFSTAQAVSGRVAARVGPFRIGATYRRSSSGHNDEDEQFRIQSDDSVFRSSRRFEDSFLLQEGAAGIGWSRGRARLDLAAEIAWVEATDSFLQEETNHASEGVEVELDTEPLWGGSLRAEVPLDAGTVVTAAVSFRDRRSSVDLRILDPYRTWVTFEQPAYGHRWNAHMDFARAARIGTLHVHGGYTDRRGPMAEASYTIQYTQRRTETAEAGLALQRPGWWGTTLHAGMRAYRLRSWRDDTRIEPEFESYRREARMDETWSQAFSWGASRTLGDLDLTGVVTGDLQVGDPLLVLDARFRF